MYVRPSTSVRRAPAARATKKGVPPTARNARTGEFTPPGSTAFARSKSSCERLTSGERPEVVVLARRESRPYEAPGLRPAALVHVCHAVHVVRLPRHAPHVRGASPVPLVPPVGVGHPVHQHPDFPPHKPRETLGGDRALHLEQLLET